MGIRQNRLVWFGGMALVLVGILGGILLVYTNFGSDNLERDKKEILKYINESLRDPDPRHGYAALEVVKDFRVFSKTGDTYALEANVLEHGGGTKGGVKGSVRVATREGATVYEFHLEYNGVSRLRSDNSTLRKSPPR